MDVKQALEELLGIEITVKPRELFCLVYTHNDELSETIGYFDSFEKAHEAIYDAVFRHKEPVLIIEKEMIQMGPDYWRYTLTNGKSIWIERKNMNVIRHSFLR